MKPKLPPRYYHTPTRARFRRYRLPPELWETWELLNALAWVNDYKFTPPISLNELAVFLTIKIDALRDRIARLKHWGWLEVRIQPGRESVYVIKVPRDLPDSCGKPASMIRNCGEDSPGSHGDEDDDARAPELELDTPVVHSGGAISTVVVGTSTPDIDQTTTNTSTRARELFAASHVLEPALSSLSERVDLETAQTWCDWVDQAPASFTDPIAYMVKMLTADPSAQPPGQPRRRAKTWWDKHYDQFVR